MSESVRAQAGWNRGCQKHTQSLNEVASCSPWDFLDSKKFKSKNSKGLNLPNTYAMTLAGRSLPEEQRASAELSWALECVHCSLLP